jgi:hypothetical protein
MTQIASQLVVVENQCTDGVLSPKQLFNLVWALEYGVSYHYNRSAWVAGGYAQSGRVSLLPAGMKPPAGAWNLILMDDTTQAGALGFHDDEDGTDIPYADVFVKTARDDGSSASSVAAHELYEMLVDPQVASPRTVTGPDGKTYIVEVADPVQGCDYDVGAPEGRITGITLCDFALPKWFGYADARPAPGYLGSGYMSFRGSIATAFELAPQGYISVEEAGDWSQLYGSAWPAQDRALPAWASRLPRIHTPEGIKPHQDPSEPPSPPVQEPQAPAPSEPTPSA